MNLKKNKMIFDIVIIGAGPVGIAFACSFAKTNMKIAIIEKQSKKIPANCRIINVLWIIPSTLKEQHNYDKQQND